MRIFFLLIVMPMVGVGQTLQQYYSEGINAYKEKNYTVFYEKMKAANDLHPYHQGIQYQLGQAAALIGKNAEAITFLKKAILTNAGFVLENNPDLKSISNSKEFKSLLALQKDLKSAIIKSDTAFTISDRQLHIEGIDYDKRSNTFYVGSIHKRKVVKVDASRQASDFCSSEMEGMTSVFGLKVDSKRNLLWVCSSPMPEMQNFDSTTRSAVFKFDLKSGALVQKFPIGTNEPDGIFGDLILNSKGQPFISDGKNNNILVVNEASGKLESIFSSPDFWNIQGLTFSPDEKFLFISDYVKGLFRLNLSSKTIDPLPCNLDVSLKGIDGLYYYQNSLIAIQNGVNPFRVTRYFLNKEGSSISKYEVLERNHPALGEPTLGLIYDNDFYYIANSQWGGYNDKHQPILWDKLKDIVVLRQSLETK